jgi:hypothetical protein
MQTAPFANTKKSEETKPWVMACLFLEAPKTRNNPQQLGGRKTKESREWKTEREGGAMAMHTYIPPKRRLLKQQVPDMDILAIDKADQARTAFITIASTCGVPTDHHILPLFKLHYKLQTLT